jgi:O-glycosyl hydrolase
VRSGSRVMLAPAPPRSFGWLLLVTAVLAMSAPSFVAARVSTAVTIDGARRFQVLDGVGVNINSLSWRGGEGRVAIDRLADEMGVTLWRVVFDMEDWEATNDNDDPMVADQAYYTALYSNAKFQNLWGTLHYLNQRGVTSGISISFMGRVPPWMGASVITPASEDEWVEMIATFVAYARGVEHVKFEMLDPLNEPDWDGLEGPKVGAAQYTRLLHKLATRLDAAGYGDVRFLGPNTADLGAGVSDYIPSLMSDPFVMARIDHLGLHSYGASTGGADAAIKASPFPGRNFWMTEFSLPADVPNLLAGNASALIMWDGYDSVYNHAILGGHGDQPPNDAGNGPAPLSYDARTGTYAARPEFYQFAALFKHLSPGSQRVGSTSANPDLSILAFVHPAHERLTLIGRNGSASPVTVVAALENVRAPAVMQVYLTSATALVRGDDATVREGRLEFTVPGGSYYAVTGTP